MQNKVGIYFAYWEQEWAGDYKTYIDKVKALGFDVLETGAGQIEAMSSAERKELAAYARDRGIELSYCIGMPQKYDLASEDSGVRRAGTEYLSGIVRAIGEMGFTTLGGILYSCWPCSKNEIADKPAALARAVASMKEVAKVAEDQNVDLCMEIVNRFEQYLLNTAREGVAFAEAVGSPRVKLLLDSFHMNIEEDSFADAIRLAGPHLGHFHMGENNRRTPGTGRLPWDEIFGALKEIGYTDKLVMEPFVVPGGQVGRDIRVFRDNIVADASIEARDRAAAASCAFVKNKLAALG